jgi:hypothetical protein
MQKAEVKPFFGNAKIGRPERMRVEKLNKACFLLPVRIAYPPVPKRLLRLALST